ncbi:MAG: serine/threonine protein kinase [Verrucomicrobiales bacterium]|jgi:serine/threonine protein kinase
MDESISAEPPALCPSCGEPLDPTVAHGLCPKCALAGVGAETEITTPHGFEPPSIERVAAAFPQLDIIELIGRGGMGAVFKARQLHLDRLVALKLLPESLAISPEFTERFTREARTLAKLNHPNIVTVHDFGHANGFFFLILEFVDGVNLREAMRAGQFTPEQALEIVPRVCEALQFAHEEGVLHRDVKPENILLDANGRVKIADFGIAKLVGESAAAGPTLTGSMAPGTPQYMAPEQIESPSTVDHRADIFSLGVVFYEMLTGELPLGRFAPPSEKSAVDSQVDEIVFRALAKERELRQQSANEVRTEIETISVSRDRHPAYAIPAKSPSRTGKGRPPSLVWPAFFGAFLIVTGIAITVLVSGLVNQSHRVGMAAAATAEGRHAMAETLVAKQQRVIQEMENELKSIDPADREYDADQRKVAAERTRLEELNREMAKWAGAKLHSSPSKLVIGWIPAALFFGLVALPGIIIGWRTLSKHRMIGVPNGLVACLAGLAALGLPLLIVDIAIVAMFRSQDLALVTALALDLVLIGLVWRWLKAPPSACALARFQETWKPAAADEKLNPWPRRIFWLIILIFVAPVVLLMISMAVAQLAYQGARATPPPVLESGEEASSVGFGQTGDGVDLMALADPAAIGGSISPVLHVNASLDPPNRFQAWVALHSAYLMTWTIEIEDSEGRRFPVEGLECWMANGNFHAIGQPEEPGWITGLHVTWLIRDGQIQCMSETDRAANVLAVGELGKFADVEWKQFRGDRSFRFSPGGWKIGSINDFQLFEGTLAGSPGQRYRIIARVAVYPMQESAEPIQLPDGLSNNQDWKQLIQSETKP